MGLFSRIFGTTASVPDAEAAAITVGPPVAVALSIALVGPSVDGLCKLSGTTTFSKAAVAAMLDRHATADRGMLLFDGALQREPHNVADPSAVAVHVEGERIGYLPGHVAALVELSSKASIAVPIQFFYIRQANGEWRGEAWTWLSTGAPQWHFSETSPPPMTAAERRQAKMQSTDQMIAEAVASGGTRAAQFEDAAVNGIHYLQTVEPIKELKRQGRLDEALALCYTAIEGAERGRNGREPAPWYTEQAAIIHRKLGQRDQEIAVLNRWLAACPPDRRDGSGISARLAKVK